MATHVKSFFTGFGAAAMYVMVYGFIAWKISLPPFAPLSGTTTIAASAGPSISLWPILIGAVLIFAAASYWSSRRA